MIFNIGYLILITSLALSLFGVAAGVGGGQRRSAPLVQSSYHAVYAVAALVLLATLILWYGLLTTSIELSFVFQNTERSRCPGTTKSPRSGPGRRAACSSGR